MTWLVWRQYRLQAAIAVALLGALAAVLIVTGLQMAAQWHSALAGCTASGSCGSLSLGGSAAVGLADLTVVVPGLLGLLCGAPLVAQEIESGICTFVWTQSVTRRHWLTVTAGWLLLAAAVWGGTVAALVTWWSGPRNALNASAFNPGFFDMQGIVPVGYALFAMALGIAAGTLLRRTVPAIAVTLGGFAALRLVITEVVRQHYMTAVTTYYSLLSSFSPSGPAWVLAQGVVNKSGQAFTGYYQVDINGVPASALPASCQKLIPNGGVAFGGPSGGPSGAQMHAVTSCMQLAGFRQFVTYQPASRYWAFQGIETGIFVALAAALIAITFVVVSRRDA
jgi:hypothetical protein